MSPREKKPELSTMRLTTTRVGALEMYERVREYANDQIIILNFTNADIHIKAGVYRETLKEEMVPGEAEALEALQKPKRKRTRK